MTLMPDELAQSASHIDLFSPGISRWEITRRPDLLTAVKVLSAGIVFPGLVLVGLVVLWALGRFVIFYHAPMVVLTCLMLLMFVVTLGKVCYDRFLGSQVPLLRLLSTVAMFAITALLAYLVAAPHFVRDDPISFLQWCRYYGNLLSFGLLNQLAGEQDKITPYWGETVACVVLSWFFYFTVITALVNFVWHAVRCREEFIGTQFDLWAYLLSPVFWLEDFEIKETGRLLALPRDRSQGPNSRKPWLAYQGEDTEKAEPPSHQVTTLPALRFTRSAFVAVGGHDYIFKQFLRYLYLPWTTVYNSVIARKRIYRLELLKHDDVWMIEDWTGDGQTDGFGPLHYVQFTRGMPQMLDFATRHIPRAAEGCTLKIADHDFFGATIVLHKQAEDDDTVTYRWTPWGVSTSSTFPGQMTRSRLMLTFKDRLDPPPRIYVQVQFSEDDRLPAYQEGDAPQSPESGS